MHFSSVDDLYSFNADVAHSSDQDNTLESRIPALLLTYSVVLAKPFPEAQVCGYYDPPDRQKKL